MLNVMMSLMLMMSILFFYSNTPISMVILIITLCFNICIFMKSAYFTSWFSYILFLVFLGGLMVLFVYVCSVASNEHTSLSVSVVKTLPLWMVVTLILTSPWVKEMLNFNTSFVLETMYSSFNLFIIFISILYLLMTLFICVQVSKMKFGPMRSKKL